MPDSLTVSLSALLTAYETSDNIFLCKTLAALNEAQHDQDPMWIRPVLDGTQTYAALHAAMPKHIRPYFAGQCLEDWVQRMPLRVRFAYLIGQRAFRLAFLRWAISKYDDPTITLEFGKSWGTPQASIRACATIRI